MGRLIERKIENRILLMQQFKVKKLQKIVGKWKKKKKERNIRESREEDEEER